MGVITIFANIHRSFGLFCIFSHRVLGQPLVCNKLIFVSMASSPPKKRAKKEIAENSDDILASYMAKRMEVCESVAHFKFNKKRVRLISSNADISDTCKGIAYWMWREQRVQGEVNYYDGLGWIGGNPM